MKRYFLLIVLFLSWLALAKAQSDYVEPGVIRVKFRTTKSFNVDNIKIQQTKAGVPQIGLASVDKLNQTFQVKKLERVFPYNEKFEARHRKHNLHLWYELRYDSKEQLESIVKSYSEVGEIEIAEPIYTKENIPYEIKPVDNPLNGTKGIFNDTYLPNQWHYNNTGQTGGTPGADAKIFGAWELTTGTPNVIVSIHDEGIDVNHEDLKANMWVNQAEKNGVVGVDDDGNGFVDDINGFNFITYKGTIDPLSHGTHVAGTVAAVNNNGIGVAGVAGGSGHNDGARVMSCQILGDGNGNSPHSYVYAADNGAVISQNSWGYKSDDYFEQVVLDAIDYFIAEAGNYSGSPMKGGVVIFASGNNGSQGKHYPGAYSRVISVNAVGPTNVKASYSNYGTWTNICAPGGDYDFGNGSENGILSTLPSGRYGYMTGTSMACPHVSGIAALVVSKYGSSTFTNEDLKRRILTGYDNIEELNPAYMGLLGVGTINAVKALEVNENIAPEKITNLAVGSVSQDFINIDWSVPADADDNNPLYFDIYYSTDPITSSNYTSAEKIRTKSESSAAAPKTYRIENLLPVTEYYFAIISIDRWGNSSVLSNVVSATTNNGPDIDVTPTSLTITGDIATNYVGSTSFNISNLDEGVLKWQIETRHVSQILPTSYFGSIQNANIVDYKPNLGKEGAGELIQSEVTSFGSMDYFGGSYSSAYVIGDYDTSLTNSSATKFYVSQDEGFNLTDIKMTLKQDLSKGPFVLEVYLGDDIHSATRLLSQPYSVPTSQNLTAYTGNIALIEQLYFEKGETFWIVIHAPSGNLFPLGAGKEANETDSDNCLMSFDLGKHWSKLQDAIGDPRYVWLTVATSSYDYLGNYITLSPNSGEVLSNGNATINVSADGKELPNGTYSTNIVINTNDKDEPQVRIPLTFTVSGHKSKMIYPQIMEFGTVLYGKSKSLNLVLQNQGLGNFQKTFKSVTLTGASFTTSTISKTTSYKPFSETIITVTFKPTGVGTFNGILEIVDANDEKIKVYFNGVGAEPPVAQITPDTLEFNNVTIGDVLNGSFVLKNAGNYPMQYFMPAYADGSNMSEIPLYMHKFGYTSQYTLNDPSGVNPTLPYVWNDIASTGTSIQQYLNTPFDDHYRVPLGFEMPFYGVTYDSIYVTDKGVITFDDNSTFNSAGSYNYTSNPNGYISAWWRMNDLVVGTNGGVYFNHEPGKLIVQYSNCGYYSGTTFYYANIQIHLFDNGNIEIYYGNNNLSASNVKSMRINIEDPEHNDMYLVNNGLNPTTAAPYNLNINLVKYSAIRIINPGRKLLQNVTNSYGTLSPGESKTINYSVATDKLFEGLFYENVSVVSNDPFNNPVTHTAAIDINAGGIPSLILNKDSLGFGQIFQNDSKSMIFELSNTGSSADTLTNIYVVNGAGFSYNGVTPVLLKAKTKTYFTVDMVTSTVGSYADELVIENSNGELFRIKLTGEIVDAPVISFDKSSFSDTLNIGETSKQPFTVTNTGGNDLQFNVNGSSWWSIYEDTLSGIGSYDNMTYSYKLSTETNGPIFRWNDIVDTGTKIKVLSFSNPDNIPMWVPVELPFKFNYYGIDYDTIYIGENGIVNFTGDQGQSFYLTQTDIPSPEGVNNFIAPLWAFGGNSTLYDPRGGVYYQVYDDKFVVQWFQFLDNFSMGSPMSVQLLLFPDGSMKFQYNDITNQKLDVNGMIGMENIDGSQGIRIAAGQQFISNKMAIAVNPAKKFVVAPSSSKNFNLVFNSKEAMAGSYKDTLFVNANDPLSKLSKISLDLLIIGSNKVTAIDSLPFSAIELGEIMAYEQKNELGVLEPVSYVKEFYIKNIGDTLLKINSGSIAVGSETKLEWLSKSIFGAQWKNISTFTTPVTLYPGDKSMAFRFTATPSGDTLADGSLILPVIKDTLVFNATTPEGKFKIPVNAIILLPPTLESNGDTLAVLANTFSHIETKSFTFSNVGLSSLNYSLSIAYKREGDFSYDDIFNSGKSSPTPLKSQVFTNKASAKSIKAEGYDNTLEYDTQVQPSTLLGYGGSYGFVSATEFVAPKAGFILSHIMTWYVPGNVLNSSIKYEIRAGQTMSSSVELQKGTFEYNIEAPDPTGSFITIPLSDSISLKPLEKFWVVIVYPVNATYPQGVANVSEQVAGRFMFGTGDGQWYDIVSQGSLAEYGWMVKALEKKHYDTGWASISSSEGSLNVGQSVTVDVTFTAAYAESADNYANIIISTNDPKHKEAKVNLYLHINQAPQLVNASTDTLEVFENSTLNIPFEIKDIENNTISCVLNSTDNATMEYANNIGEIIYSPDYESAGVHTISITLSDEFGHSNVVGFVVKVLNKNRVPQATTVNQIVLFEKGEVRYINVNELFNDPDGDEMNIVSYQVANITNVGAYQSGNAFVLIPGSQGTTTVTFNVVDAYGALATNTLPVEVSPATGVDDISTKTISVYPNPTTGLFNVTFNSQSSQEVVIKVVDTLGLIVKEVINNSSNQNISVNIGDLPNGLYIVQVNANKTTKSFRVVKI